MKKTNYLSFLSVISCLAVVFLHTNGCFWNFGYYRYWKTANIIESVFYFAVPIFFMISGANLINYSDRYNTKEYFKKRIKKVIIPALIWSVFGLIYYSLIKQVDIKSLGTSGIINAIINFKYPSIYWYFPCCIILYLIFPLLTSISKDNRKNIFMNFAFLYFAIIVVIPFFIKVFNLNITSSVIDKLNFYYVFYAIVGYLINEYNIFENKKYRYILYFLGFVGLLAHIIGTYVLSTRYGYIVETYKGYDNLPCIVYSIAIFVFFKYFYIKISNVSFVNKAVSFLSKYTFSIYLIHIYFHVYFVKVLNVTNYSIIYRLGAPFIIIPICILITYLLRKIKYIRNIVPE